MEKVTTFSVRTPRSTRLTLARLFTNTPDDTSSAVESAICAVTSTLRKRAAPRLPEPSVANRIARNDRTQYRLRYTGGQNNDAATDLVTYDKGQTKLQIVYVVE